MEEFTISPNKIFVKGNVLPELAVTDFETDEYGTLVELENTVQLEGLNVKQYKLTTNTELEYD